MRTETKEAFQNILDTFSGADGGVKFAMFRGMIEGFDEKQDVDFASKQLIDILLKFSKLIDAAQPKIKI